jgi:alanine racemase
MPACAVIDLDAIRHNVAQLRERTGGPELMAVVKADGYGHGLLPCAEAAVEGGAGWLGVAQLSEALALRAGGVDVPILSWLTVPGDAYPEAVRAGIDIGISAGWALTEAADAARACGVPARVQLKLDTGLGRNGVMPREWPELVEAAVKLQADGAIELVGAFSHFAWADDPGHPTVRSQVAGFAEALDVAARRGARFAFRHLANSAATLTAPDTWYDIVRPGLAVYGLSPVPQVGGPAAFGLRPAMTLLGRVATAKEVPAGHGVSYGHAYTTSSRTVLALLPLGYADGLPRHATNAGPVWLRGRRHTVAGRVCMDQIVLDVGLDAEVAAGDVAVLFGPGTDGEPTAQDWAEAAGTISYEIVSRIGSRVPRRYLGGAGERPGGVP